MVFFLHSPSKLNNCTMSCTNKLKNFQTLSALHVSKKNRPFSFYGSEKVKMSTQRDQWHFNNTNILEKILYISRMIKSNINEYSTRCNYMSWNIYDCKQVTTWHAFSLATKLSWLVKLWSLFNELCDLWFCALTASEMMPIRDLINLKKFTLQV